MITQLVRRGFLGFDTTVFDAVLPTTSPIIRGETTEERATALAKTGRTASAGGIFRNLGSMVYNSEELLRARQIQRDTIAREKQDKSDASNLEMIAKWEEALLVYQSFLKRGEKLESLSSDELSTLIKYIVAEERKTNKNNKLEAPSHFTNIAQRIKRLKECDPVWTNHFSHTQPDNDDDIDDDSSAAAAARDDKIVKSRALEEAVASADNSFDGTVDPAGMIVVEGVGRLISFFSH